MSQFPQDPNPPPYPPPTAPPMPPQQLTYATPLGPATSPGMAITSLVLGILSLLCACVPMISVLTPALGIAAVILGVIAFRKARYDPAAGPARGMALAGAICGGINLLLAVAGMGVVFWAMLLASRAKPTPATPSPPPFVMPPAPATAPATLPADGA